MLKGKWGSGKTYFIDEYKKTLKEKKYIYVSLYGIKTYDEIETKFFEVLHPILSNKKSVLVGKIAKGLLKATLKVDLDGDNRADGNVSGQIPNLDTSDFLNTQNHILIFDDLERCSILINDILGYINYFVEHEGYKVIIIANEEEIDKKSDKYKAIKEKLIGKTFELTSNVEMAFDSFIDILDEDVKSLIKQHEEKIIQVYNQSGYDNLRLLRQTLLDFERFYKAILISHTERKDLIREVLSLYLIFSFENKYGNYDIFNLENDFNEYLSLQISQDYSEKEKAKDTKYYKLIKKYNVDIFKNCIFDISEWESIISKSLIDSDKLNKLLKNSQYYIDENSPNWRKLWNFRNLDDDTFKKVLDDTIDDLNACRLNNIIEVRHTNAILINLNKYGLCSLKQVDIYKKSKNHIDYLYSNSLIDRSLYENNEFIINEQFNGSGLGYFDENNYYCKLFINYLIEVLKKGKEELFKKDAFSIVELLDSDFNQVKELFVSYAHKAFLHYIDVKSLVEKLSKIDNEKLLDFGRLIKERYKHQYSLEHLDTEIVFLNKLKKSMTKEQKKYKGLIKGHNISVFIEYALIEAIENLQNYLDEKTVIQEVTPQ